MGHGEVQSRFARVDEARDPRTYVSYLDEVSALEGARAYKEVSFRFLEPGGGDRVLDVGCGVGTDVRELAGRLGEGGRVVGADGSVAMVREARNRALEAGTGHANGGGRVGSAAFLVADAMALPFPDETFDGARIDRVLQHLERPRGVLDELVRVVRPGGRVVACEPDWETLVVTASDRGLTRRILNNATDRIPGGWIGRELVPSFRSAGLVGIRVTARTLTTAGYGGAEAVFTLRTFAAHARKEGAVSGREARAWLTDLQERDREGRFFSALTVFVVAGRR